MNYALIGCGRIAVNHIKAALNNKLKIVAVCDVKPEAMEALLSQYDLEQDASIHRYTDYRQLLAEQKPQLAAIATESGLHAQIALECIDAGVNVIIEKPMAMSIPDADEIIRRSEARGIKVCACHQNRFNRAVQETRQALESGRFGRLSHGSIHVRWNRDRDYYAQAPWRGTWAQDGGCLMNQCIHGIDLLRWMLGGEIEEVYGVTRRQFHEYLECEDVGMAVVKFINGAVGTIEGTTNVYPKNLEETLYIFGEKGTVKAGGQSVNVIEEWRFSDLLDDPEEVKAKFHENPPNVYGFGHTPLYADMINAIKNDRQPYITAMDGKKALELVLAIYKSAAEGIRVKFPLVDCASTDFTGRF